MGRASVYVCMGPFIGEFIDTIFVPGLKIAYPWRVRVTHGREPKLTTLPSDTALYPGASYIVRAGVVDRAQRAVPVQGTVSSRSSAVAVGADGTVTAREIGRASLLVQYQGRIDSGAVSVVPRGRIAAARLGDTTAVTLIDLDGSRQRTFRVNPRDAPRPAWHPSGAYLVNPMRPVSAADTTPYRIGVLDTVSGIWTLRPTTPGTRGDGPAAFSPDGEWMYVIRGAPSTRFVDGDALYRVRVDGSGIAELVGYDPGPSISDPSVSPDGKQVAMSLDGNGLRRLIVPTTPPLGPMSLSKALATGARPVWSPVGDDIIMFGTEGIWTMPAASTAIESRRYYLPLAGGQTYGGFSGATWSPDGRWILTRAPARLVLIEVATGLVLPLAFGENLYFPAWRPR